MRAEWLERRLIPLGDGQSSRFAWAAIHALAGAALVWFGGYALLKRVLAVCVGAMFATVTLTAFLLAPDWSAVGRGLIPSLPAGGHGWIVGLIGAIGGTMALISYGYWIREEGRSGEDGLRACRFDLLLSYAVIGLFGIAVVIIGSRVQVRGQGTGLALLLADQLAVEPGSQRKVDFPGGLLGRGILRAAGRVAELAIPVHGFSVAPERRRRAVTAGTERRAVAPLSVLSGVHGDRAARFWCAGLWNNCNWRSG